MTRLEVIAAFAEARGDAAVICGPGASSGMLWEAHPDPATIYNMELAYATPMAYGIALGAPGRRVVAIDGDGSLFAAAPVLGTIARHPAPNFTVIVVANGIWGTGDGSVRTTLDPQRWTALASACGWPPDRALATSDLAAFAAALERSRREPGPWLLCAITERSSQDASGNRARPGIDTVEAADLMRRALARSS